MSCKAKKRTRPPNGRTSFCASGERNRELESLRRKQVSSPSHRVPVRELGQSRRARDEYVFASRHRKLLDQFSQAPRRVPGENGEVGLGALLPNPTPS